jgi:hypothetical protein
MASPGNPLFTPTGANQYTDTNYALPGMGAPKSDIAQMKTGFEMFTPPGQVSPVTGTAGVASGGSVTPPGVVPPVSSPIPTGPASSQGQSTGAPRGPDNPVGEAGGVKNVGSGAATVNPLYPDFTQAFYNYLMTQMGKGATPFNLSAALPSSGQATTPGSLTAPLTDINQMLEQFYKTGTGGPAGTGTLQEMSKTGAPTDVGPAWQAMLDAQQRNIGQNAANLREQFAFGGDLKSSPFGQSMTDFYGQTAKDQNALLAQMQQQASEAAAGRRMTAGEDLTKGGTGFGEMLQGLDQQSIQNMLAEFVRTRPEYSPLLGAEGGASTTFAPTIGDTVGVGGMGGAASSAGSALSGIADLWSTLSKSSGPAGAGSTPA